MTIPILFASVLSAAASAQVVRVPATAAAPALAAASAAFAPAVGAPAFAFAPSLAPSLRAPELPTAPAAFPEAAPAGDDRQAVLVGKILGGLCSADCVSRRKSASWAAEVAAANPREAVQLPVARGLIADAAGSNDLLYFEHATALVEGFASASPHDSVFGAAVDALIAAARASGRAQRQEAVSSIVRLTKGATPERRERAAKALESLRGETAFLLDADSLERAIARARG